VEVYTDLLASLIQSGKLDDTGVAYDPYHKFEGPVEVLGLIRDGQPVTSVQPGDEVDVLLPKTDFYVESGGQVSDTGRIVHADGEDWAIEITAMRKPAAGVIVHQGKVIAGTPKVGDSALAEVDRERRREIMRNHTATHLLHAALHQVLGTHAQQAGSLVAPDRLRFDFNHPQPMTREEILEVEAIVNREVLANHPLNIKEKPLQEAIGEGAMALFGEKYGATVRTITIGDEERVSYELCGGTHVDETGDIGLFLITYEGSIAAGVRRIEAVTGWRAYEYARQRMNVLDETNQFLGTAPNETVQKVKALSDALSGAEKEAEKLRTQLVAGAFDEQLDQITDIEGIPVLKALLPDADMDALREMADKFRQKYPSGVVVLASASGDKPILIAAVTDDLVKRGLHAGKLVQQVAKVVGGGGGGRPNMAQAGAKDASKLSEALDQVAVYIKANLK
jgi:alanyl-tRNA synthetase